MSKRIYSESNPYREMNSVVCPVPSCQAQKGVPCDILSAPHMHRLRRFWEAREAFEDGLAVGREEGMTDMTTRMHKTLDRLLAEDTPPTNGATDDQHSA